MHERYCLFFFITLLLPSASTLSQDTHPKGGNAAFQLETGFVANAGQLGMDDDAKEVLYFAHRGNMHVHITSSGFRFVVRNLVARKNDPLEATGKPLPQEEQSFTDAALRIELNLMGANPNTKVEPFQRRHSFVNYYLPHCPNGIVNLPEYERLVYRDIYPRIDMVASVAPGGLHYEFYVHPGGDPKNIRFEAAGFETQSLNDDGTFRMQTSLGTLVESAPFTYQIVDGKKESIAAGFVFEDGKRSFAVSDYDPTRTLIIDPWVTYIGGSADDRVNSVTTNAGGNVIFGGETQSVDFPRTPGFLQDTLRGGSDSFIAKFKPTGERIFATYLGGSLEDRALAVTTGANKEIIYSGTATSTNFPTTPGVFATTSKGSEEVIVVRLDSNGTRMWASYYGGKGNDRGSSIAVDSSRNIIVAGHTLSSDLPMPTNALQRVWGGWDDGFIVKFTSIGKRAWSTYYGGSGGERLTGVTVGEKDNLYFSGRTWSQNFPVTPGAFQTTLAGSTNDEDAVVVKLDSSSRRIWSTYLGGSKEDIANAIVYHKQGKITVTGRGASTDFPVTTGAFQSTPIGMNDPFVTTFDSACVLQWSTYYGGSAEDEALAVTADTMGNVYVAGSTNSINLPVPLSAAQTQNAGAQDAFVVKFDGSGNRQWASYFGGIFDDFATCIAWHRSNIFMGGRTLSDNLPLFNPLHTKLFGADGFLALFTDAGVIPVELVSFHGSYSKGNVTLTWITASETENYGFEIERQLAHESSWSVRGFVRGHGTTALNQRYQYVDPVETNSIVHYRLKQRDYDGSMEYSPIIEINTVERERSVALIEVHPSPVQSSGVISFFTPYEGAHELYLCNTLGHRIQLLFQHDALRVGYHSVPIDVGGYAAGNYFLQLQSPRGVMAERLIIQR